MPKFYDVFLSIAIYTQVTIFVNLQITFWHVTLIMDFFLVLYQVYLLATAIVYKLWAEDRHKEKDRQEKGGIIIIIQFLQKLHFDMKGAHSDLCM